MSYKSYVSWRNNNPQKYSYNTLKNNAKRRDIDFKLTFEEFKQFCFECELINQRGRSKNSYHIDRIDENRGYEVGNLQMLTNIENVKKYYSQKKYIKQHSIWEPEY